jgi:hypothetical protein
VLAAGPGGPSGFVLGAFVALGVVGASECGGGQPEVPEPGTLRVGKTTIRVADAHLLPAGGPRWARAAVRPKPELSREELAQPLQKHTVDGFARRRML